MPTIIRKRRAQVEASPSPPPTRRRRSPSSEDSVVDSNDDSRLDGDTQTNAASTHDQMVKKLIRLALASEYSRQPLRRSDINAKVLAPNSTRIFKAVFASAQTTLRHTFGMTLTALPTKEKITVSQKRAAQRATGNSQGNISTVNAYILTSTLPAAFRNPAILSPPKIPSVSAEASYVGLYTFVVSVIYLSEGGRCSEGRLEKALNKVNAEDYVLGGEKTDKVLKRMERDGYIVKIREREAGGDETVEWVVGPRGKVEVGETGVAGLVRGVYRGSDGMRGLDKRLERSLGVGTFQLGQEEEEGDGEVEEEEDEEDQEEDDQEEDRDGSGEGDSQQPAEERPPARRVSGRGAARAARRTQMEVDDGDES